MANRTELSTQISELQEVINALSESGIDTGQEQQQLQGLQQRYDTLIESNMADEDGTPMAEPPAPAPAPSPTAPPAGTTPPAFSSANFLSGLQQWMQGSAGSGADSAEVRAAIQSALDSMKVKVSQLDQSVLDEIKKNQTVILEIPSFGNQRIVLSKDDLDIPYFFEILDDVAAGNNVYLIGEAGGGKTYAAEKVAEKLQREYSIINCSQYTSPTEVVGGQTIEGYKDGKLIQAWRDGKILILDEMPRLDPNTAGLFNDALAKSSKTRPAQNAKINSTNPEEPPVVRNDKFALIGTGNVYPNTKPPEKYAANKQQDLSLLDRFSGSVYRIEYSKTLDERNSRYQFIYDMLVGNYHKYMNDKRNRQTLPQPTGLRTILKHTENDDKAVVSYRTLIAFRVAFEFELVRAIAAKNGVAQPDQKGKTLLKAFESFMVAFDDQTRNNIINQSGLTTAYIERQVKDAIDAVVKGEPLKTLTQVARNDSNGYFGEYQSLTVPDVQKPAN